MLNNLVTNPPNTIAGQKLVDITTTDGVRYMLESDDWILIRPSGTEPLVRIYLESKSKERFQQLKEFAQKIIHSY